MKRATNNSRVFVGLLYSHYFLFFFLPCVVWSWGLRTEWPDSLIALHYRLILMIIIIIMRFINLMKIHLGINVTWLSAANIRKICVKLCYKTPSGILDYFSVINIYQHNSLIESQCV